MGGFIAAVPRGAPASEALIQRAIAASRDRAPDGVRHVVTPEGVLLVQCMFANTPESVGEQLPLADPSGRVWIVKRGHLNNIDELRGRLRDRLGGDVRVHTDAEVMLAAYLAWGADMAGKINGEFTLAIWDGRNRSLFVLRDHLGLRGCYTHDGPDWYVAASEPAQVLPFPGVSDELDEVAVADFISGWPADRVRTFYQGIGRPMPATAVRVHGRGVDHRMYWNPTVSMEKSTYPPSFYAASVLESFERAVRSAMRSPTAVVCDLSGGLDSSAVLGMAAKLHQDDPANVPEVIAHSMMYPGLDCDETDYINAVLEKWPVPWVGFDGVASGVGSDDRDELVHSIDLPIAASSSGSTARVQWMADRKIRVRLDGAGGDELFWTAPLPIRSRERPRGELWPYMWWASRQSMGTLAGRIRREIIRPVVPPVLARGYLWLARRSSDEPRLLTSRAEELRTLVRHHDSVPLTPEMNDLWEPAGLMAAGLNDAAALRRGHEVRSPFRDLAFTERVLNIPLLTHRWAGVWRALERESFRTVLPLSVFQRLTKAEFSYPSLLAASPVDVGSELTERGLVDESALALLLRQAADAIDVGDVRSFPWALIAMSDVDFWIATRNASKHRSS